MNSRRDIPSTGCLLTNIPFLLDAAVHGIFAVVIGHKGHPVCRVRILTSFASRGTSFPHSGCLLGVVGKY